MRPGKQSYPVQNIGHIILKQWVVFADAASLAMTLSVTASCEKSFRSSWWHKFRAFNAFEIKKILMWGIHYKEIRKSDQKKKKKKKKTKETQIKNKAINI